MLRDHSQARLNLRSGLSAALLEQIGQVRILLASTQSHTGADMPREHEIPSLFVLRTVDPDGKLSIELVDRGVPNLRRAQADAAPVVVEPSGPLKGVVFV